MGYFAKKTITGYKEVIGGCSDAEAEVYIETLDEYFENLSKIREYESDIKDVKVEADRRVQEAYSDANRQLQEYISKESRKIRDALDKQQCAEKIATQALAEKKRLEDALERQQNLNNNLRRIARERANAKRGLTPKKEHSGYVVLYSAQYKQHCEKWKVVNAWHSVLQTPYDASLPLHQIKDIIADDLIEVFACLGIRGVQDTDENGNYVTWTVEENGVKREVCGLYRWDYRANYKSGLWEMNLYHTKSIRVPEEYRPRKQMGEK